MKHQSCVALTPILAAIGTWSRYDASRDIHSLHSPAGAHSEHIPSELLAAGAFQRQISPPSFRTRALCIVQAFGASVMLAEIVTPCTALLAHKLDLAWVNHWPLAPFEPEFTSLWSTSNRRMFQPNPLSYYPQTRVRTMTQSMVSIRPQGNYDCCLSVREFTGLHLLVKATCLVQHQHLLLALVAEDFGSGMKNMQANH